MIVIIDNYDSFTYNLVQFLGELGQEVKVFRHDEIDVAGLERIRPDYIVVSPGPGTPREAGISMEVIRHFAGKIPLLGIGLGHLAIGQVYGGEVVPTKRLMHGKISPVYHDQRTIFQGLPSPFEGMRYHSLMIDRERLPAALEVSAWTEEGEIMAVRHKDKPIEGVQFHPESIFTPYGKDLLRNFLDCYAPSKA